MALTITNQITGQQATSTLTYCYLFEPLKVTISDSDNTVENIFADLTLINTKTGVANTTDVQHFVSDISSGGIIEVDISEIIKRSFDFNIYKINNVDDISSVDSWKTVVSEYIYKLEFYTDKSSTKFNVLKLPIIGGRDFETFEPLVDNTNSLTEIDFTELQTKKLGGYSIVNYSLKDISSVSNNDYSPNFSKIDVVSTRENTPCGGVIVWKSKLGGWLSWGMDISIENKSQKYDNKIDINNFSTTNILGGKPYVPVDYSGVSVSKNISLKSIDLENSDIKVLSEINGSPVVYYQKNPLSKLELMRVTNISAPLNSLANGGTFSINLSSILENSQKTK